MSTQQYHGFLVDTRTGDAIDAGQITLTDQGGFLVQHGPDASGAFRVSPYTPTPYLALFALPVISAN